MPFGAFMVRNVDAAYPQIPVLYKLVKIYP
jgi:hypothetical protein